jgi:hypothetical protein
VLALVGLGVLAWVIQSVTTPVAFQTPLVLPVLVAACYSFLPAPRRDTPPAIV